MAAAIESDMSFLDRKPVGQVRLFLNLPDGSHQVLQKLNLPQVICQGSLLNFAFECAANGTPAAEIDVPSVAAGIGLVRFIYTKNYGWPSSPDDVPLLLTAHVFALGYKVDNEELYHQSHVALLRKVNHAADYPSPPSDLCATIRFLWTQTWATTESSAIKGDILHYCVTAFDKHNLGSNPEFIKLSEEHVNFVTDLSKTNSERDFAQVGIMQLPGPNRSPARPLEEDFYIAWAFSSHGDEDSIDSDDDIDSTGGTISEDGEDDCEDFCANDTVPENDEGDGEDFSRAEEVISEGDEEGEGKDSSSTIGTVAEAGESDGEGFCTNGTISEDDEVYSEDSSSTIDVISDRDEEGDGGDFSSTDGEDFSRANDVSSESGEEEEGEDSSSDNGTISKDEATDSEDFSGANDVVSEVDEDVEGEDSSSANDVISEGEDDGEDDEDDEGDEQPASLFHLPMRPKPNSQADMEFATAPTSPTSEASYVVVDSSVPSTFSESDSESEWQVL
ncbi:hypothetical protein BKA80DRAFT_310951 [Phyllosticta citrichinensis]